MFSACCITFTVAEQILVDTGSTSQLETWNVAGGDISKDSERIYALSRLITHS